MSKRSYVRFRNSVFLLLIVFAIASPLANAGVPDWLRQLARAPLPAYKADIAAVVLLDEEITTVSENGEIHTVYRRAVKILRPTANEYGQVRVHFDSETKLTWLKGWSIAANGQEYEVKEKDAVETNALGDSMYSDAKVKVLLIPAAEPGAVVGFEYQQNRRSSVFQDWWTFQEDAPVRLCRYTVHLPRGWEYQTYWANHTPIEPKHTADGETTWEVADVPELEEEDYMPPHRAIAGRMVLHFFASGLEGKTRHAASWDAIGAWYANLLEGRRAASPEIKQQVAVLTAASKSPLEKISVLSAWVQRDVRYVAVEIGIGGYQPHFAADTFRNRYGDCKDKVTLLSTMLKEIGIDSEYVLVHTDRGVVNEQVPTSLTFNHVILAIKLPPDVPTERLFSLYEHPRLGRLLLFDPTSELTALGDLPASLQQNAALLLNGTKGEMLQLPLLAPVVNRLSRTGKLDLLADGTLTGQVEEWRTGSTASMARSRLLNAELSDRSKSIEAFLSNNLGTFRLTKAEAGGLQQYESPLILRYQFQAPEYAKRNGPLMLVRPRVMGHKSCDVAEGKKRHYPVEFNNASDEIDTFEISLPAGYEIDEIPDAVDVAYDFGEYHSHIEQAAGKLKYSRHYTIKQVIVPTERLDDLRKFYRQIAADEKNMAVLKKVGTK
jgi:hypothetical protein